MAGFESGAPNTLLFRQINKADVPTVGGKAANLGELANNNFPVPPGFVVTAQAYFRYLDKAGIRKWVVEKISAIDVEDTEQLRDVSAQVRELIIKTKMSTQLANEIKCAYRQLGERRLAWLTSSEEEFVAVRSSATAEDLPEASFAGQQETYLNVKGASQVVDAVQRCWASLFTARAVYYREKNDFPTERVGIAVVVQKMVDSKVSGVLFTADPTGDEGKIVIEAGFGLGEAIVSGSITPDTYTVDKGSMKILDKKVQEQEFRVVRKGRENAREKLSAAVAKKQKIADKTIIALAKLGKQIELHYKRPQDVEWAIEDKELFVVQSRAITTLGLKEKVAERERRKGELKGLEEKIILHGLAASPGTAAGKVKVVLNESQIGKVEKGDVLVAKMTAPAWVPVMKKAAAIVTDEGGITCHAAIVSRELGIPCVVGTEKGTQLVEDNDTVTVNGYDGVVYRGEVAIEKPREEVAEVVEKGEVDRLEKVIERELGEEGKEGGEERRKKGEEEWEAGETPREKEGGKEGKGEAAEEKKGEGATGLAAVAEEVEAAKEHEERVEEERNELIEKAAAEAREIVEEYGEVKAAEMPEGELREEEEKLLDLLRRIAVKVKVNVALPDAAAKAAATGAVGVGLLRAEHMITAGGKHPAEFIREGMQDELVKAVREGVRKVAEQFKGKPVWYRTFDARSDEFRELQGGEKEPEEDNPMLGWHGIRRDLDEPQLLKAQFKAVKGLVEEGFDNIGIMLPFVQSAEELRRAKEIARECGLEPDRKELQFGVMIETPASVWSIDEFIKEGIDFISFGTNDLTQLTLGIDRNNERLQGLFTELHPAVLRQLRYVIRRCKKAGVQTSICGQAASNPEMVRHLVRFGIDSVSANIDAVEKIKRVVLVEEKRLILDKQHKK